MSKFIPEVRTQYTKEEDLKNNDPHAFTTEFTAKMRTYEVNSYTRPKGRRFTSKVIKK